MVMAAAQGGGNGWQMLQVVRRGLVRAEGLIRHPKELLTLLTMAERRLDRIGAGPLTPIKKDVQTLLRLMRAYGEGRYRQVSGRASPWPAWGSSTWCHPSTWCPTSCPAGSPTTRPSSA